MNIVRSLHIQLLFIAYFGVVGVAHAQPASPEGAAKNEAADWIVDGQLTPKGKAEIDLILENRLVNLDDQALVNLVNRHPEAAVAQYLIKAADDANRDSVTRQRAMAWLAYTRDDRAEDFLRSYVEKLTPQEGKVLSFAEYNLLHAAIISQGAIGSDSAIDYLLQIASKDFWDSRVITCSGLHGDAEDLAVHMRKAALWGIVRSETDRAIALFPKHSNPMPDLLSDEEAASLARTARLRAQKIYGNPDANREPSQKKVKK
ncbi:MAG: hypothetical protein AMXMBFR82_06640 [Candidatus Hydrogenedentota bacterium]